MTDLLQPDMNNINAWCKRNRLQLSLKKSKVLLIASQNKLGSVDYNIKIKLDNTSLHFVDNYKYLGITIDKHMDLTCLLSNVKKTVSTHLFKLRKLRKYVSQECAVTIYKQTILPLLDYSGFLLNSCNVSDRNDLQILQNDALRTGFNIKRRDRMSIRNMHREASLLSLDQRRKFQLLALMFIHKTNHNVRRPFNRATRGADRFQFYLERYNNVKYKNSPYYKGSLLWDALPLTTIDCDTLYEFKKHLKKMYVIYLDV